jgi:uncharacterized protein (TIGR02145 family)
MPPKHLTLAILLLAFTAHSGESTITYANKTYKTAKIGTQTWMAENLNYEAEGSVCYENNPANCAKYGRLYNWETAMKVCPKGWHLPSNAEWDKLLRFVDGDKGTKSPYNSETAGQHLKTVSGWNFYKEYYGNGTDDYGFSALPGGNGGSDGNFNGAGHYGGWWSAGEYNSDYAYGRSMI